MALLRGLRRRLRQANPCTSCLAVAFLAALLYLISAISGTYFQSSAGAGGLMTAGVGLDRDGGTAGHRSRWRNRTGSFIVGDDEVQLCTMTSRWASSAVDQHDFDLPSTSGEQNAQTNSCSSGQLPRSLFYVDAHGALVYNHTAAAGSRHYDVVTDSCAAWKIEWNSDNGYVEKKVSTTLTKIDADFVHVSCRLRLHRRRVDSGNDEQGRVIPKVSTTPRARRRERFGRQQSSSSSLLVAERRARQMHRDQLRRRSPHLVGAAAGLPDPFSHVLAAAPSGKGEKYATPREFQPGPEEQLPGSETHAKPSDHVEHRKPDVQSVSRSKRDADHEHGSDSDDDGSSAAVYHQWIARIHSVDEAIKLAQAHTTERRQSEHLNVLVLALESVSSIAFDRHLSKSHRFLVNQPHTVFFTGYNVIGDAAPANIIPLLTGVTFSELANQRVGGKHANFIDSLPFVWNKFEQAGYVTLYAEDGLVSGDLFHTDFYGFEQPPVHHYMRPFWQAAADLQPAETTESGCLGPLPEYEYVFSYVEQFLSASYPAHVPRFAFAFVSGSAENVPASRGRFDEDFSTWLEKLEQSGVLERTAVVLVGDHGPSYGPRRQTELGRAAERLPLLVVSLPRKFVDEHSVMMKNLATNSDRLVTPLDVHQTLLALLDDTDSATQSKKKTAAMRARMKKKNATSLFDEIPIGRTCQSAGVAVHWCMCTYTQTSSLNVSTGVEWQLTADWVVSRINELLRPAVEAQLCQPLALMRVVDAHYLIPTDLVVSVENRFYYGRRLSNFTGAHLSTIRYQQIVVTTQPPHGGVFEATVVFDPVTKTRQLSGEISRISAYTDESDCVLDQFPHLRRFCFCN